MQGFGPSNPSFTRGQSLAYSKVTPDAYGVGQAIWFQVTEFVRLGSSEGTKAWKSPGKCRKKAEDTAWDKDRRHFMRTNLATVLDPNRRSADAGEFEAALRRRIVGQDQAVEKVAEIYQMFLAGLNAPGRPVGNLLFLGPTGSGKTRVVEAMAEALFGDAHACIKIDCAEFQHSHEIAKLIGSPPGYLGHRETHPLLTQEALNQWYTEKLKLSILLFDEIEKASDSLWQLLLGILDKATLTLGDNRRVDL